MPRFQEGLKQFPTHVSWVVWVSGFSEVGSVWGGGGVGGGVSECERVCVCV